MNGEEMDGGVSLDDMEKALVCLLMTSMEAPVQAETAGLTQGKSLEEVFMEVVRHD